MPRSAYHLGLQSTAQETLHCSLTVDGSLPPWLAGTLVRTAPAKFELDHQACNHWFDGLAMLHAFSFANGTASFTSRWCRGKAFRAAEQEGKIGFREFATDPCFSLFGRVMSWFSPRLTDNCNVSIHRLGLQNVALTETRLPICFDLHSLQTLGVYEYSQPASKSNKGQSIKGQSIKGPIASAHPHYDARRGKQYSYTIDFGRQSTYRIFSVDQTDGRHQIVSEISVDRPAYIHSFGMTDRYLVFIEFPLVVHPLQLRFRGQPFIRNYRWRPERGTRIHVIDKDTGRIVQQARTEPMFAFHHINAFEREDALTIDLVTYRDARVIEELFLDRLRGEQPVLTTGNLTRLIFAGGNSAEVHARQLTSQRVELPRIHYAHDAGRDYRFAYFAGNHRQDEQADFIDNLIKFDFQTHQHQLWSQPNAYPGEPVFVANPDRSSPDAGVILSVVLDATAKESFLLVLNAEDWQELARVRLEQPLSFGFHGNFFPNEGSPDRHR